MSARRTLQALAIALGCQLAPRAVVAQSDSLSAWTQALATGTLPQRMAAVAGLVQLDPATLPVATRQAIAAELTRLNNAMLHKETIPGAHDAGPEGFGEYYADLTTLAASLRSPDADRALVLSVGVSRGVERRVAELGDAAVPALADMIANGYESNSALETMARAWFWADSTGNPLSPDSRQIILRALMAAATSDDGITRLGAVSALELIGDPAFLPLAQVIDSLAVAGDRYGLGPLRRYTLPALTSAASKATPPELGRRLSRLLDLPCLGVTSGARRGACESLQNLLADALGHIAADRTTRAVTTLSAFVNRANQARIEGALTETESRMLAGDGAYLLNRIGQPPGQRN